METAVDPCARKVTDVLVQRAARDIVVLQLLVQTTLVKGHTMVEFLVLRVGLCFRRMELAWLLVLRRTLLSILSGRQLTELVILSA